MAAEEALLNISISSSSGIRATSDRMPLRAIGSSSTIIHFIISIVNGLYIAAYTEYALDSYEVDAVDYLVKPIEFERFQKAVNKAINYHALLVTGEKENIEEVENDYLFVKSERRYFKVNFEDILFIEGLKDYVILQLKDQRIITKMTLKAMQEQLPASLFFRINKSYIINTRHITSFDNNDVTIRSHEIAIGNSYRDDFFEKFVTKRGGFKKGVL